MLKSAHHQTNQAEDTQWNNLSRLGGISALLQMLCAIITILVVVTLGAEPATAEEYFRVFAENRFMGLIRLDFTTLLMLSLFPFTSFGIYAALRKSSKAYAALAVTFILVGMVLGLANHSAFSMIHLSDQYAAVDSTAQREQLLAAANAVIATDMWNSTAGFLAGIFMQGAFVFISFIMLHGEAFGRWTAWTGILANGLDLLHVFVALFVPSLAVILLSIGGLFYLVWFPLLARDLIRAGRGISQLHTMEAQPAWEV